MDLRRLRYFEAVARTGSFTAAADTLNVSQPALSYHIKALEDELGMPLFDRHAKGSTMTEAGESFLRDVRRLFDDLARAQRNLDRFRHTRPTALRLGMAPTAGRILGPQILAANTGPRDHFIEVREGLTTELIRDLRAGDIEASVCYETPTNLDLLGHALYEEDLVLVGSGKLIPPGSGDIDFDELVNLELVIDRNLHLTRQLLDSVAAERGVALDFKLEVDANHIKRELITRHGQCSVVPFGYINDQVAADNLRVRRIVNPSLTCTTVLLAHPELSPAAFDFIRSRVEPVVRREIESGVLGWRQPGDDVALRSLSVRLSLRTQSAKHVLTAPR